MQPPNPSCGQLESRVTQSFLQYGVLVWFTPNPFKYRYIELSTKIYSYMFVCLTLNQIIFVLVSQHNSRRACQGAYVIAKDVIPHAAGSSPFRFLYLMEGTFQIYGPGSPWGWDCRDSPGGWQGRAVAALHPTTWLGQGLTALAGLTWGSGQAGVHPRAGRASKAW